MVAYAYSLIIWVVEAGGLGVQVYPGLHSKLEASLGCMKP